VRTLRQDLSPREQRRGAIRSADRDLPTLLEGLRSPDRELRVSSAVALGKIGTARAIDSLIANLRTSDDASVLTVSAREFSRLGELAAVPTIESVLIERGDEIHSAVGKRALVGTLGGFAQRSSVPALRARLADPDGATRKRAARALRRINYPESRGALEQSSRELSWWRGRWARRALASMITDLTR
jgi:HEAT repeat protein